MEKWSKIVGFDGYSGVSDWEVSSECSVRQFGRPIEPKVDSQGYRYIQFCRGGELQRVHRLMLLAFEGPPPEGFIAVSFEGKWRWGPRDMVKVPVRGRAVKPKKKRAPKGPRYGGHFDEWLQAKVTKNST
jgi:hypothetical protein